LLGSHPVPAAPSNSAPDVVGQAPASTSSPTSALLLRANVDRLVAGGRVVLAAIAMVAVALDPTLADRSRVFRLLLVALYLAWALGQLAIVVRTLRPRRLLERIEFASDAIFVCALTLSSGGRSALVFSFFVFFIVAAGVRRPPRAVLLSGITYFCIFLGAMVASRMVSTAAPPDLNQVVIRSFLLALSAAALTVFAVERQRLFASLTGMAGWPLADWSDLDAAMFGLLGTAADLAPGSRVALVWADNDEPWTNVALLDDELTITHVSPGDDDALPHIGADDSFVCARVGESDSIVRRINAAGVITSNNVPLSPELLDALSPRPRSIVGVPACGQFFSGHLLILDWDKIPSDFVLRTEILARQIASSLDVWLLSRRARDLAARDERARVWRDLHDGVLQSLTGLALMLQRAEQMVEADPVEARRILGEAGTLVHDEQRDLRLSILEQKAAASSPGLPEDLPALLAELARRFEQVWGLRIDMRVDPNVSLPPALAVQISRMIQEALSNSARHGHSTRVQLDVSSTDDGVLITIEDNGKGFPFIGTFSYSTLLERRLGPVLLKDRVQRLQGTLDIRSATTGVGLDIRIPMRHGRLAG
jgi:signal transduction histidine kinase